MKQREYEENKLLNRYMLMGWGVILLVLTVAYAGEVLKGMRTVSYVVLLLASSWLPFLTCLRINHNHRGAHNLRYHFVMGYIPMYILAVLSGRTGLEFVYIFPLLCLLMLYGDPTLVGIAFGISVVVNGVRIAWDWKAGLITTSSSADYEIRVALILMCFGGCMLSSKLFANIRRMEREHEAQMLELQRKQLTLEEKSQFAYTDSLTGLYNRRKLDERIGALSEALPSRFSVVLADLNGLKAANDTRGHTAGDALIVGMAQALRRALPETAEIFRMGGDEFIAFLYGSEAEFVGTVSLIYREMNVRTEGGRLSASVGCIDRSELPDADVTALIREAERRMYENKQKHYMKPANDRRARNA